MDTKKKYGTVVTARMPDKLAKKLDRAVKKKKTTRNKLIKIIIEEYLAEVVW